MKTKTFNVVMGAITAICFFATGAMYITSWAYEGEMRELLSDYAMIPAGTGLIFLATIVIVNIAAGRSVPSVDIDGTPAIDSKERARLNEAYKQRVDEALQIALGNKERITPTENIYALAYTEEIKKDDICMICKLFLKEDDVVMQCPICNVLYHEDHLLNWIRKKKHCPVCATELYSK